MSDALTKTTAPASYGARERRTFGMLTGIAAAALLLQGLWAGLFMSNPDVEPEKTPWLEVHSWGGKVAIGFAILAAIWAFMKMKGRKDLAFGASALAALLILESWVGGLVVDDGKDAALIAHMPIAMAAMALAVWLPLRSRHT